MCYKTEHIMCFLYVEDILLTQKPENYIILKIASKCHFANLLAAFLPGSVWLVLLR
jgi:hypothetical protein